MLSRSGDDLEVASAELRARHGVRVVAVSVDVAEAEAVDAAAARIEAELGAIDVWVNAAMATVFCSVNDTTPEEFKRATEVTYLGQVYGTMAALERMRARNRGTIVNVGSALAYRSVPLQAAYCGAKFAVRGFTDSLRSEIMHDGLGVHLTMVHLPAVNTPQFDWALNKTGRQAQPVPPVFQPEVAVRAIYFAATHRRRELWVGFPTVRAILANRVVPGLLDRYLAKAGYTGQLTAQPRPIDAPANLFQPVPGKFGAHGRFDALARSRSWELFASLHREAFWLMAAVVAAVGIAVAVRGGRR